MHVTYWFAIFPTVIMSPFHWPGHKLPLRRHAQEVLESKHMRQVCVTSPSSIPSSRKETKAELPNFTSSSPKFLANLHSSYRDSPRRLQGKAYIGVFVWCKEREIRRRPLSRYK